MEALFGISTSDLSRLLAAASCCLILGAGLLALRSRTLFRMGVRNAARRPLRSVVIVLGLMLSTLVVATAFSTGDAMTLTIRGLITGSIGSVDEVVTAGTTDPTQLTARNLDSLTNGGGLPSVKTPYFPDGELQVLQQVATRSKVIAGVMPAILEQAPMADAERGLIHPNLGMLALPTVMAPGFAALHCSAGGACWVGALAADEVFVNRAAADLLGTGAGRSIAIYLSVPGSRASAPVEPRVLRVRDVVGNGDLAGAQATVFLALEAMQSLRDTPGQINQTLVLNRCVGPACSHQAALDLRKSLVDRDAAESIRQALSSSNGRSVLNSLQSRRTGKGRDQIKDLQRAAANPHVTDRLIYLLGDPQIAGTLRATTSFLPSRDGRVGRTLRSLNHLNVVEIRQSALDEANQYGNILTSSFLVLGLFSIASSLLLVFLVFVMLAAERRSEMGIARAIGLQRLHLVQSFSFEGLVYDLAAAAAGLLAGVLASRVVIGLVARALTGYGIPVRGDIGGRSLVIAFCLGLLATCATVVVSAWRVSRVNIVEAIRGIGGEAQSGESMRAAGHRRVRALTAALHALGSGQVRQAGGQLFSAMLAILILPSMLITRGLVPTVVGLVLLQVGRGQRNFVVFGLGVTLALIGGALLLRWAMLLLPVQRRLGDRCACTLAGIGVAAFWAIPPPLWTRRHDPWAQQRIETFALAGLMLVLSVVVVVGSNLTEPLQLLLRPVRRGGAFTAAVKMAVAYPLQHRFRTGVAVAMFSLVIFTMVVSAVLLESAHQAYMAHERPPSGYDIAATAPELAGLNDIRAALTDASSSRPEEFDGIGSLAGFSAEVVEPRGQSSGWRTISVRLADDGLLAGTPLRLAARSRGFSSDGAVWDALLKSPGTAVIAQASLPTGALQSAAGITGLRAGTKGFPPLTLWLRDGDAAPLRLSIIGVVEDRGALPSGLLTRRSDIDTPAARGAVASAFLFKTRQGRDPGQAALGLDLSFALQGLQTDAIGEGLRNVQTVRGLLNYLLEGFVGLGLVSGMAALGVISTRAVVERRQEIGMLRAIGLRRRLVQFSFLLEVSLIAWLGITLGVALGLLLARNVIAFLALDFRELTLRVPWQEVALIALLAYAAAMATTLFAAWQAGRIDPAEALRYE